MLINYIVPIISRHGRPFECQLWHVIGNEKYLTSRPQLRKYVLRRWTGVSFQGHMRGTEAQPRCKSTMTAWSAAACQPEQHTRTNNMHLMTPRGMRRPKPNLLSDTAAQAARQQHQRRQQQAEARHTSPALATALAEQH